MKQIKFLVLAAILAIAAYAARYAFIWASTPVDGTGSFDYIMAGVFAIFGVFTLSIFAIMLVYSILESQENKPIAAAEIKITVELAPAPIDRIAAYNARQNAAIAAYNARQAAAIAAYKARQAAAIAAYNARTK
jgi:hypothetical protein